MQNIEINQNISDVQLAMMIVDHVRKVFPPQYGYIFSCSPDLLFGIVDSACKLKSITFHVTREDCRECAGDTIRIDENSIFMSGYIHGYTVCSYGTFSDILSMKEDNLLCFPDPHEACCDGEAFAPFVVEHIRKVMPEQYDYILNTTPKMRFWLRAEVDGVSINDILFETEFGDSILVDEDYVSLRLAGVEDDIVLFEHDRFRKIFVMRPENICELTEETQMALTERRKYHMENMSAT